MRTWILSCVMMLSAIAVAQLRAIEQKPLPAFEVVASSGAVVSSKQLSTERRWLLLYVAPGCRSCDQLLGSLKEWHTPQLAARTVIVVRASHAQATDYIAAHLPAEASDIRWYADANATAWQALALTGTPVLLGVEAGEMKWMISGVLNDARTLESVVQSWVK